VVKHTCSNPDCSVSVTGKCLLSHTPLEKCPNVKSTETENLVIGDEQAIKESVPLIYPGFELGIAEMNELMSIRYGHLIGVIGEAGTGKTCLLSALYLLISCGDLLPAYLFAGSTTLPGFENRLRLLRHWGGGGLPDKITEHTVLSNPREPGFLHLALKQTTPNTIRKDIFFSDLPGEWTKDLIKHADVAVRFQFLRRADGLVIALPCPVLLAPETKHTQVSAVRILLQRLKDSVGLDLTVPLIFAITRCDLTGKVIPPAIHQIAEYAEQLGFENVSYTNIASFSERIDVPSGMGISSLIDRLLNSYSPPLPVINQQMKKARMFERFKLVLKDQI
jgi:hypothetical protein